MPKRASTYRVTVEYMRAEYVVFSDRDAEPQLFPETFTLPGGPVELRIPSVLTTTSAELPHPVELRDVVLRFEAVDG